MENRFWRLSSSAWAAIGTICLAISTAVIAYQAYLMREQSQIMQKAALDANLQAQIISECASFLYLSKEAIDALTLWASFQREEPWTKSHNLEISDLRSKAAVSLLDVGPAISKLQSLSSEETSKKFQELDTNRIEFLIFLDGEMPDKETETGAIERWNDTFTFIEKRCRSAFSGSNTGFL